MRKWGIPVVIVLVIAILIWLPIIPVSVSPEITLQAVDVGGHPVGKTAITQFWGHWTYENRGHEEEKIADEQGYVTFSEKSIKVPVLKFIFLFIAANTIGVIDIHGSYGPHSSFSANGFANTEPYSQCTYSGCRDNDQKLIVIK